MSKGWKSESARHAMAAKGYGLNQKYTFLHNKTNKKLASLGLEDGKLTGRNEKGKVVDEKSLKFLVEEAAASEGKKAKVKIYTDPKTGKRIMSVQTRREK